MNSFDTSAKSVALDCTNALICTANAEGYFVYVNPFWEELLGWTLDELCERPYTDFVHPDDLEKTQKAAKKLECSGIKLTQFKNRYQTKSGAYVWLEWTARATVGGLVAATARNISKEVEYTQKRERHDALLKQVAEMAKIGHWQVDLIENKLIWSDEVYSIHGVSPETYSPDVSSAIEFYHPDDAPIVSEKLRSAIETCSSFSFQLRIIRADSSVRTVACIGEAQAGESGAAISVFGTFQDLTDFIDLETEHERLSQVAKHVTTGVVITDAFQNVEWVNEAFRRMSGYSLEEVRGKKLGRFLHGPETDPKTVARITTRLREKLDIDEEILNYNKLGKTYWNHLRVTPIFDGDKVQRFIGIQHDVSERKLAELKLIENERRYRDVVENLQEAIILLDEDGYFVYVNQYWQELSGISVDETLGKSIAYFFKESVSAELFQFFEHAKQGQGGTKQFLEVALPLTGEQTRYVDIRFSADKDYKGSRVFRGSIVDRTEHTKQRQMLEHAQRMELTGRMVAGICHDFNNLLGVIRGNLDLLALKGVDENIQKNIESIDGATERGAALTKKLLKSTRNKSVDSATTNIDEVFNSLGALINQVIPPNIKISFFSSRSLQIYTNAGELEDSLLNLVMNAKNSIEESGEIIIESNCVNKFNPEFHNSVIEPTQSDYYAMISVVDTGKGIDEELFTKIFSPFFTTDSLNGTGLGLSMVAGFASRYGYGLTVHSTVGRGSTFSLWMPCEPNFVELKKVEENSYTLINNKAMSDVSFSKALVVDDEVEIANVVTEYLSDKASAVYRFNDSSLALTWLKEHGSEIDLLITDEVMPGDVQGHHLIAETRKMAKNAKLVLMSGYMDAIEFDLNGVDLLAKPFNLHQLDFMLTKT